MSVAEALVLLDNQPVQTVIVFGTGGAWEKTNEARGVYWVMLGDRRTSMRNMDMAAVLANNARVWGLS